MRALIGYTGFVGGNVDRQGAFDARINSKNIGALAGSDFDEIWCAGIQAVKWWANQNPDDDWRGIKTLLDVLETVKTRRFVLISTVDVFRSPVEVDERTQPQCDGLHAYGLHRLRVENWVREHFPRHLIVRLPGLYGDGLMKNVIYDLLTGNNLGNLQADAIFQFYNLARLTTDIDLALSAELDLVHFATEPVSVADIAARAFDLAIAPRPGLAAPRYDMRTIHAGLWKRNGYYLETREEVLRSIRAFVASVRFKDRT